MQDLATLIIEVHHVVNLCLLIVSYFHLVTKQLNFSEQDAPVHSTVLVLKDYVKDEDVHPNPLGFDYELLPYSNSAVIFVI